MVDLAFPSYLHDVAAPADVLLVPTNSCVQEFPVSDTGIGDAAWRELCRLFTERNSHASEARGLVRRGVAEIARLYEREGEARWGQFLAEHGIEEPRRGPKAVSRFHGVIKYLLGLGVSGDTAGTASVFAAVLDEWLECRDTIRADQIPEWIATSPGGARAIYERRAKLAASPASGEKRYWLTPPDRYAALNATYRFDFDPCPNPRPESFDGLTVPWGRSNWCNPPFPDSFAPWIAKAWEECRKGNLTVMVVPIYKNGDIARLDVAGAEIIYWGIPDWLAIEDGTRSPLLPGQRQPCVLAVFHPQTEDGPVAPDEVEIFSVRAQVEEIKQWQNEKLTSRVEP